MNGSTPNNGSSPPAGPTFDGSKTQQIPLSTSLTRILTIAESVFGQVRLIIDFQVRTFSPTAKTLATIEVKHPADSTWRQAALYTEPGFLYKTDKTNDSDYSRLLRATYPDLLP